MDRTNFVDGPILPASWLNRIQDKAEGALEAQSKALLAGEIVAGLELTLTGALNDGVATISPGLAYDSQGRPIPAAQALTVSLADVPRPPLDKWRYVTVWVRAAVHRSGSVHDLDNVAHDLYLDDGAEAGIDVGAVAGAKPDAVRPALAAGKVLLADVAVNHDMDWAALGANGEITLTRRHELTRDAGAIDRALIALQAAVATLQATVARVQASIPGRPDLSGLATTAQLAATTLIANAAKATAEAAVTAAQLAAATPDATTAARGLVELATEAEVLTGTDSERAVTPRGLAGRTASEARDGIVRLASRSEVQETAAPSGTDFLRAVSIGRLRADLLASETRKGLVELASTAEAQAGADTARAVTAAGMRAHGDARYRDVVLSTAPALGVVNLSEPVANFRWIRALNADGAAKDFPIPLGRAWRPETYLLSHRAGSRALEAINLTTGAVTTLIRNSRPQNLEPYAMARIGSILYFFLPSNQMIDLNDPDLTVRDSPVSVPVTSGAAATAVDGLLYVVGTSDSTGRTYKLWSANPSTGAVTEVGTIGRSLAAPSGRAGIGMAAIGNTVYLSDADADTVLTIDLTTAQVSPLPNPLGVSIGGSAGIGMFSVGAALYLSSGGVLYTVNTATGIAARSSGVLRVALVGRALTVGHLPEPGAKVFADGTRSVVCRVPGATHLIGVR